MRVDRPQRAEYLDRGPIHRGIAWTGYGVAEHGLTTRASYTVPTGKVARIMAASLSIVIYDAPGTAAEIEATFKGTTATWLSVMHQYEGGGSRSANCSIGSSGDALAGEVLTLQTRDLSLASANSYRLSASIMEYNI